MLHDLRQHVAEANRALVAHDLVTLTWGNVSGIDRDAGLFAIKPSGVPYDALRAEDIVLVDLDGAVASGDLHPSSDTPTHLVLYRAFEGIGGITHTHSTHATTLCQARVDLPCLGTTHADHFMGTVPCTRQLMASEVEGRYEAATGDAIVECLVGRDPPIDPALVPAVLVAGHAPFAWGRDAMASVRNAVALEACAHMAILSGLLVPGASIQTLESHIL
ncbi:MAG: L-ribulose-5-phosphate 4-epimerase AraD, partial [Phycisphaerales bacterium]|nr:L-ribulose-5-phosphate 4-epimerase AraD [Phycisphaerales bacterium]